MGLGRGCADRRLGGLLYRRDDGSRTKIRRWCQNRDGGCCTRRQPLEPLMDDAWTHEHIKCLVLLACPDLLRPFRHAVVYAGPALRKLSPRPIHLCAQCSSKKPPILTTFPCILILRSVAYPINLQLQTLSRLVQKLSSATHLLLTCNCRDTMSHIYLSPTLRLSPQCPTDFLMLCHL